MPLTATPPTPLLEAYLDKRDMLLRYFIARTHDEGLAQDIIQELYFRVAALGADYAIQNHTALLFRMAQNIWLNHLRALSRTQARDHEWRESQSLTLGGEAVSDSPSAEVQLLAKQQLELVEAALSELPEKTQKIVRLHKFDGLNQAEVADRLAISRSSIEKHLSAALKHLLARLRGAAEQ